MAICKICGRKGLFLKLIDGKCNICQNNQSKVISNPLQHSQAPIKKYRENLSKNFYYFEAKKIYDEVIAAYKDLIKDFSVKSYKILECETVFVVEDSFIVYIGLIKTHPEFSIEQEQSYYRFFDNSVDMLFHIHLEELMPNELFKFVGSKFTEQFKINSCFFNIKKFAGENNPYGKFGGSSVFEYVNSKLPDLNLHQRYLDWKGYLYYFIIYEITDGNNRAFCLYKTKDANPNKIAISKIKLIEQLIVLWRGDFNYSYNPHEIKYNALGFAFNDDFRKVSKSIVDSIKSNKEEFNLYGKIKFCIANGYIKQAQDLDNVALKIFEQSTLGKFDNIEKFIYKENPIKWKSEYLVKEICEKLYGVKNVIYQYRPYFLHTDRGQLSYDIFLPKFRIAIEYQGKQHFEPIDYFGGEPSFTKQHERDLLKMKLSEQNNIKLIYITYKEPITKEYISQKVNKIFT